MSKNPRLSLRDNVAGMGGLWLLSGMALGALMAGVYWLVVWLLA